MLATVGFALLVAIGTLVDWVTISETFGATALAYTYTGLDTIDGQIAFVIGLVGLAGYGLAPWRRLFATLHSVAGGVVALGALVILVDPEGAYPDDHVLSIEFGVVIVLVAGAAWSAVAIASGIKRRR